MTQAPVTIAKRWTKRFLTMPLKVYYIDMPGAGLPGSDIIGTGTKESIIAKYNKSIGTTWRRDLYFWFENPFDIRTIRTLLYDDPSIQMAWDDLRYKAFVDVTPAPVGNVIARIMFRPLAEDYSASFSYSNLPSFLSTDRDLGTLDYWLFLNIFEPVVTQEYTPIDGLISGAMRFETAGIPFNEGDEIYGFRLRWELVNANQTDELTVEVGDFKTGDPNYSTWKWPDDVWCWVWDTRN